MKRLLQFVFSMLFAAGAWAGTYTAASCNQSDVNACVNSGSQWRVPHHLTQPIPGAGFGVR